MNKNIIPDMVHPLGRSWVQPKQDEILIDDKFALMSESNIKKLSEYSFSIPSGVYEGKMWRRCYNGKYFLRWYIPGVDPGTCGIKEREIIAV